MSPSISEMSIFVYRHLPDGQSSIAPCKMSVLNSGDADEAIRLNGLVSHGLSLEIFAASSDEEIIRFLGDEGIAVGVRFEDRLICVRTLKIGKDWVKETLSSFGQSLGNAKKTAITGYCIVDKEFRGNNIQFITQFYAESIIAKTFDNIVTTVSPKNIFSLQNVLSCGYTIIGIESVYGGYLRYVLRKDFRPKHPIWTHGHLRIPIRKISDQKDVIAEGHVGYKIVRTIKGFSLLYGRVGPKAEE